MKKPPAFNPQVLAEIPIAVVAGIAAQIQTRDNTPTARIREAYALLDAAEAGRKSLLESGSYEAGLAAVRCLEATTERIAKDIQERRQDPLIKVSPSGDELPVDFKKALLRFFSKTIKPQNRETKLVEYLAGLTGIEDTLRAIQEWAGNPATKEGQLQAIDKWKKAPFFPKPGKAKAEKLVADWKKNGIPAKEYFSLKSNFPRWYDEAKRKNKSKAGKAPKGKQGRVVRRNDKRRGSRPQNILRKIKKIL